MSTSSDPGAFRTLEVSEPELERDGLRFVTVKSPALRGRGDITLYVPPEVRNQENVPIVLLLHGVYGSHWAWAWAFKGGAHLTAQRLVATGRISPMILAMPSDGLAGDGTGYVQQTGADYEQWIVRDVPSAVRQVVHGTAPLAPGPLFLAGLSMGGFGALRLGARHGRQVFRGLSGLSSITQLDEFRDFVEEPLETYGLSDTCDRDLARILVDRKQDLPPLRFDCGRDDALLAGNRSLHHALETASINHHYEEFKGGHDWDYWSTHLTDTLVFFQQLLVPTPAVR